MEILKTIDEFPNYQVSNHGRVFSKKSDKFLKPYCSKTTGYFYVSLFKDGKQKSRYVHRLVALAYIDNPESKPLVDHIDRNTKNNQVANLRWATSSENNHNRKDNLPLGNLTGKARKKAKYQYYRDTKKYYCECCDKAFDSPAELKRHNKTKKHISKTTYEQVDQGHDDL